MVLWPGGPQRAALRHCRPSSLASPPDASQAGRTGSGQLLLVVTPPWVTYVWRSAQVPRGGKSPARPATRSTKLGSLPARHDGQRVGARDVRRQSWAPHNRRRWPSAHPAPPRCAISPARPCTGIVGGPLFQALEKTCFNLKKACFESENACFELKKACFQHSKNASAAPTHGSFSVTSTSSHHMSLMCPTCAMCDSPSR